MSRRVRKQCRESKGGEEVEEEQTQQGSRVKARLQGRKRGGEDKAVIERAWSSKEHAMEKGEGQKVSPPQAESLCNTYGKGVACMPPLSTATPMADINNQSQHSFPVITGAISESFSSEPSRSPLDKK